VWIPFWAAGCDLCASVTNWGYRNGFYAGSEHQHPCLFGGYLIGGRRSCYNKPITRHPTSAKLSKQVVRSSTSAGSSPHSLERVRLAKDQALGAPDIHISHFTAPKPAGRTGMSLQAIIDCRYDVLAQ
jgi:hypothetical protein